MRTLLAATGICLPRCIAAAKFQKTADSGTAPCLSHFTVAYRSGDHVIVISGSWSAVAILATKLHGAASIPDRSIELG